MSGRFSGPIIDINVFPKANLPTYRSSHIPHFDVEELLGLTDGKREPRRFRFWFNEERGGWVWEYWRSKEKSGQEGNGK